MAWRLGKRILSGGLKLAPVFILAGVVTYFVALRAVTVDSARVLTGDVIAEVMGTGTLEARTKATISPKIPGRLAQITVDQGARVVTWTLCSPSTRMNPS